MTPRDQTRANRVRSSGGLDRTDEPLGRRDVVVACVHSDLCADAAAMTDRQGNGCQRAVECGVPAERVVRTPRSADEPLAWTRG